MRNIVVTGATSFIGVNLLQNLLADKETIVYALVRPDSQNKDRLRNHKNLVIVEESLQNIMNLSKHISEKIDVFYHLAWEGTRGRSRDDRSLQEKNYELAINTIKVASELGCASFVGIGSQAEYGKCIGKITEKQKEEPITEYGKAKLRTYEDSKIIAENMGLRFVWARIFSVYGKDDFEGTLIMSTVRKMLNNESIPLTECTQTWDFLHVTDAANALNLLSSAPPGAYNIASGINCPLKDFIFEILRLTNSASDLKFGAVQSNDLVSFAPVVDKLITLTGWKPQISFRHGISEIIEIMRKEDTIEKDKHTNSMLE